MAKKDLTGKKIAILVDEGFEQVELIKPRKALDKIGGPDQDYFAARRRSARLEHETLGQIDCS